MTTTSSTPAVRRLLRVLVSVLAAAALLVGVPWLLASTIGNPLDRLPDLMVGDVSSQVMLAALATVVWIAWGQFTVAFAVELWSAIRRTPMPAKIPGVLTAQQGLARALINGALVMVPVTTAVITPAAQAMAMTPPMVSVAVAPASPMTADAAASAATMPTRSVTVAADGARTWWDLATTHLGDGTAWHQLWELNKGRTQNDGTILLSDATPLRPGWTVLVPDPTATAEATGDVVVRPGDTLARIADDHGQGWNELWVANAGRLQPDGVRFADPDHIEPGWTITIPAPIPVHDGTGESSTITVEDGDTVSALAEQYGIDEADLTEANRGHAQPDGGHFDDPDYIEPGWVLQLPVPPADADGRSQESGPAPQPSADEPASADPGPASATPQAATTVPESADGGRSGEDSPPQTTTVPAEPGPVAPSVEISEPPVDDETDSAHAESSSAPNDVFAGAGGAIIGALLLTALLRARRRQRDHRRPGERIAGTPPELVNLERVLRSVGGAAAADAQWLDQALHGLGHTVATTGGYLPDVIAACATEDELRLVLSTPSAAPVGDWAVHDDGSWVLSRTAATGYDPGLRDRHLPPYPTLTTVGSTADGEHWLLDLERIGALTVTGDTDRVAGLARFMAAELAHNSWSELSQVTLVGFGREMAEVHPDRLTYAADPSAAIATVTAQLRAVAGTGSADSVLTGRCQGAAPEAWAPHVLLIAPDELTDWHGVDDLLATVADHPGRSTVGLVVSAAGPVEAGTVDGWTLQVDTDGTLIIPKLDLRLRAHQLPAADAAQLTRLLTLAADPGQRTKPTAAPSATPADEQQPAPADQRWARAGTDLPLPAAVYLDRAATTDEDLATLAPPVPSDVRREVAAADPDLDTDLAEWADPVSRRPRIGLLGAVEVLPSGGRTGRKLAALKAEAAVHLAVHSTGVTPERLGADLWPTDPTSATSSKLRQVIYELRRSFGVNPATGLEFLPRNTGGAGALYRLEDVLIDAELFRRLRVRASARTDQDSRVQDWWTALRLVRGAPLDQRRAGGYAWLAARPIHEEYRGSILDVAHLLATHHLSVGEPEHAEAAARIALSASESPDDISLLDLMWACDAQDRRAEGDAYADQIRAKHGDVLEDCPPRTYELLLRRQRRAA
jgi:LysM repeat protein